MVYFGVFIAFILGEVLIAMQIVGNSAFTVIEKFILIVNLDYEDHKEEEEEKDKQRVQLHIKRLYVEGAKN